MRLLFDQNLSHRLVSLLADQFPGSRHVRELGLERVEDAVVWSAARAEGFAIVSKDADFHQRSFLYGSAESHLDTARQLHSESDRTDYPGQSCIGCSVRRRRNRGVPRVIVGKQTDGGKTCTARRLRQCVATQMPILRARPAGFHTPGRAISPGILVSKNTLRDRYGTNVRCRITPPAPTAQTSVALVPQTAHSVCVVVDGCATHCDPSNITI